MKTEFARNQPIWNQHYSTERSRQEYPDENVVRHFHHYLRHKNAAELKILDLGSGSGRNLNFLRRHAAKVVGQDFAFNALRGQKDVFCALAQALPYPAETFDFVLCWGILHYLDDDSRRAAVAEIWRVLKKDGELLATLRSDRDTHLKSVTLNGDLAGAGIRLFSEQEARQLLAQFGQIETGFICRQPPGNDKLIAHHILVARK